MPVSPNISTEPLLLEASKLAVSFPRFSLGPIDLILKDKAHLAVLGPSGSGKSTLLRLLCGHGSPESGQIWVDEKPQNLANQLLASFRGVEYVPQDCSLPPFQTVYEVFSSSLSTLTESAQQKQITYYSNLFYINNELNSKTEILSQGQMQRCCLALAFCRMPRIVALDEPFSHQDAFLRQQLLAAIHVVSQSQQTTLLVCTHSLEEALFLAEDAVYLTNGQIIYSGPIRGLSTQQAPEIQALFGWKSKLNARWLIWRRAYKARPDAVWFKVEFSVPRPQGWLLRGQFEGGTQGWVLSRTSAEPSSQILVYPSAKS